MLSAARRFGVASAVAIAVLLATGIAMASQLSNVGETRPFRRSWALLMLVGVLTGLHIAFAAQPGAAGALWPPR